MSSERPSSLMSRAPLISQGLLSNPNPKDHQVELISTNPYQTNDNENKKNSDSDQDHDTPKESNTNSSSEDFVESSKISEQTSLIQDDQKLQSNDVQTENTDNEKCAHTSEITPKEEEQNNEVNNESNKKEIIVQAENEPNTVIDLPEMAEEDKEISSNNNCDDIKIHEVENMKTTAAMFLDAFTEPDDGTNKTQAESSLSTNLDVSDIKVEDDVNTRPEISKLDLSKINEPIKKTPKLTIPHPTNHGSSRSSSSMKSPKQDDTFVTGMPSESPYSNEDVERALDRVMKSGKPPPEDIKVPVIQLISRKRIDALYDSDYELAEQLDSAYTKTTHYDAESARQAEMERRNQIIDNRNQILREEAKDVEAQWDEKIEKHQQEIDERRKNLQERHEEEVEDFKARWQDPEFVRQFNKPSSSLLQMRYREKRAAISKQYQTARESKKLADRLQREEEEGAKRQVERAMEADLRKIRERQQREVDRLDDYEERTMTELRMQRDRAMRPFESAFKSMQSKRSSSCRIQSVPPTLRAASALSLTSRGDPSNKPPQLATPRTASKVTRYRSEERGSLNVTPVDEKTLSRLSRSKVMRSAPTSRLSGCNTSRRASSSRLPNV